ncbi:MAG: hypothetical protein GY737_00240 [Desulfobacteraceae bacterium]|nr:hypothetical protein [Desulfobacteraceae bacterium]
MSNEETLHWIKRWWIGFEEDRDGDRISHVQWPWADLQSIFDEHNLDADRTPRGEPLAPLPEWLKKVDEEWGDK